MANGLDVKVRDFNREIDADDPLMELSRIMGFDKPATPVERADPQIAIEDSFSMDLERELALEEIPGAPDAALDAEFTAAFEDELSDAMQFGDDVPSVVPSLEDELSALLEDAPAAAVTPTKAAEPFPAAPVEHVVIESEDHWSDDQTMELPSFGVAKNAVHDLVEEEWVEDSEPEFAAAPVYAEPVVEDAVAETESSFLDDGKVFEEAATAILEAEPAYQAPAVKEWLDSGLDDELEIAEGHADIRLDAGGVVEADSLVAPLLATPSFDAINRAFSPTVDISADESELIEDDFEFNLATEPAPVPAELETASTMASDILPVPEFEDWQMPEAENEADTEITFDDEFGRILAGTAPEPVVDADEPLHDHVKQTDDFEIPDFDFDPEPAQSDPASAMVDDQEPSYAGYEPRAAQPAADAPRESDFDFDGMLDAEMAAQVGGVAAGVAAASAAASSNRPRTVERVDADFDFQPFGDEPEPFPEVTFNQPEPQRRSWLVPALLAGVALFGGGLYYAFSGNGLTSSTDGPVLVKADPEPVKIAPENTGGKAVPDQDKAVYDKVDGDQAALPTQGTLVSESEEPVDIASVAADAPADPTAAEDSSMKSEARIEAAAESDPTAAPAAETSAVSPKKVRTFIVKPDGTLVERPADADAPVAADPVVADQPVAVPAQKPVPVAEAVPAIEAPMAKVEKPAAETPVVQAAKAAEAETVAETKVAAIEPVSKPAAEDIAKLAAAKPATPAEPAPVAAEPEVAKPEPAIKVVKTKKIKAPTAEKVASASPADGAPVLESRPADQPVNIVGKTGGTKSATDETQVASADATPAATAGSYSIQIASTPSPEAAKSTYAALNRKYGGVIGGKGVNIQKAEVSGKGTVYRVRIPAGSKQDATALCAKYKSSGGSCFVTR
jgi:hypothetical protein